MFFTYVVLYCIHCFAFCFFHLVYLGSSLFNWCPSGEYLFPIFFYLNSTAIIIPYRCHFTWMQIYLWGEILEVALLSQGVSLLLVLVDIAKLLSHRLFQFALCQPMFKSTCFPLVKYLLSNTLIFVILASLSFVLHLSYCEWGWTSFPMIKNRL